MAGNPAVFRVNPKYPVFYAAAQQSPRRRAFVPSAPIVALFAVYLIVIGWIYVALMMAVAEATASNGSLLGAVITFLLYGVGPVALLVYLLGTPARRRRRRAEEAAAVAAARAAATAAGDAAGPIQAGAATAADSATDGPR